MGNQQLSSSLLLCTYTLLCLSASVVNAIRISLPVLTQKCISEEIRADTLVSGSAEMIPFDDNHICVMRISDSKGATVYENSHLTTATFAFTTNEEAEYSFCFLDQVITGRQANPGTRSVDLKIKIGKPASEGKDYDAMQKAENLKPLELELRKLEDMAEDLRKDFEYMKNREARHRDTSGLSVVILAALGVGQIYYLKKYFKSKKLI